MRRIARRLLVTLAMILGGRWQTPDVSGRLPLDPSESSAGQWHRFADVEEAGCLGCSATFNEPEGVLAGTET